MKNFSNFPLLLIEGIPRPLVIFNSDGMLIYANEKGNNFIKEFFSDNDDRIKEFLTSLYQSEETTDIKNLNKRLDYKILNLMDDTKVLFIEREKSIISPHDLMQFFAEISQISDINAILNKVSDFILHQMGAGKVTIFLYSERERVYRRMALSVRPPFRKEDFKKDMFNSGEGLTGKVIQLGTTFYAPDVEKAEHYYRSSPHEKSELVIPIKDDRMVYGTIGVGSEKENAFSKEDIKTVEKISKWLLFIVKNLYVYQDVLREKKAIEIIGRISEIFKNKNIKQEYKEFINLLIREYGFSGGGIDCENINFWVGEGEQDFGNLLKEKSEKLLSGCFSTEKFNFYVFPLENLGGFFAFSSKSFYSNQEIEHIEDVLSFLESFLVREIRKEIGSIHRKIFGTFIKGIHDNRKASEIYEDLCKVLNEIFDSEKSFIIYEKGKKWNMVASFPKEIEIDYSFLDLNIKDEFSEERITMFFERKEGSVVISVLKPRNLHSIRLVKDTLGDYLDMILKLERFQRNSELLSTLQKLLQAEVSSFSLVEYLDEISKLIKENLGYAFVGILLREGDYLKLISAWGSEKYKDLNVDLKIGEEGISGVAYKKGETVYSPDVSKDPFYVKVSDEISSEISVPLKSPKGLLGTLVVSSSKPYAFSDEDIAFLETLAEQISLFIQERLDKEEKEEIISFLEEESKFNEMIIRNLPIGIVVIDNDLKIKRVNEGMVLLLKRNVKEMLGSKICEILCSHEEEGYCKIKDSFLNRKILFKEKFIIDVEGESVPMAVTSSFIYTSYNVISGIILMVEDIREVAKLEEQLRRSERLSAIGKIAAYMAHEIKNPLASISTGIEFVSEKLPPDESVRGYMNMILKEIYRLDRLIKNLLSFASRKPLNKVSVNVFEILNECITLLTPEIIGKDIKLKTDFKEKELMVHLDPDQFKEVVLNLVRNAIDAIDKDGEVELGFEKVGSRVVFWCKDNGKGIREEYVHNIFEPFFSTKKGGSGLGLAIVHKIVEDHGGKIEVESDYGKGTIFKVYLPL